MKGAPITRAGLRQQSENENPRGQYAFCRRLTE
jgi:hypothetical protein